MTAAIYSRKSKLTETGDSIKNQINMCKEYAGLHFGDCNFLVYEDEGFSGGNTDRPMFKQMLDDAKKRKFQTLICYRLDRISRNVNDFSATLKILENNNIAFVSVTERFDTSTPMGKAMLSISSVFAELERDTIAQRITDNFTQLAKTGRYLTGRPPEGFITKRLSDSGGKTYNILETVPDEAEKIKLIYKKYLEWESSRRVELYCLNNGIKTKLGSTIRPDWIMRVLTHQLYAVADETAYEYFQKGGYRIICDKEFFDGSHGIMVFRRTKSGRGRHMEKNEPAGIYIGVGSHDGLINSRDWIAVQKTVNERSACAIRKQSPGRKATGHYGALNGVLHCGCGAFMRPVCIRGEKFYYTCLTKEHSRRKLCGAKNLRYDADAKVTAQLHKELFHIDTLIRCLSGRWAQLEKKTDNISEQITAIEKQIIRNKKTIENLILRLSENFNSTLAKYIESQIEKLDADCGKLQKEVDLLRNKKKLSTDRLLNPGFISGEASALANTDLNLITDTLTKRNILKSIIKYVKWSGNSLQICYHFTIASSEDPTVITLRDIPGDVTEP